MEAEFWHDRWENNRLGFHQADVNEHLKRHWKAVGPQAGEKVFVPLCGKAHDLAWLKAQGHPVLGVELSPIPCRDFFGERGLVPSVDTGEHFTRRVHEGIELWCGDFFHVTAADLADVSLVYDRAALIALPKDSRRRYAEHLKEITPAGTRTLLITLDYPEQGSFRGPPFNVSDDEVRDHFGGTHWVDRLCHQAVPADDFLVKRGLQGGTESVFLLKKAGPDQR